MSIPSDRNELATLVTSLRRHLQRQERVGIRFLFPGEALQTNFVTADGENLLSGTEGDLFSDSSGTYKAKTHEKLREAIGILTKTGANRAEQVQTIFSDKTPPPK